MANICVTGSRSWCDRELLEINLAHFLLNIQQDTYLHVGDARGADQIARDFARAHNRLGEVYYAQWDTEGRSAGPRRNERMLIAAQPALLLAFRLRNSPNGSRGTDHCIETARKRRIPVIVIESYLPRISDVQLSL